MTSILLAAAIPALACAEPPNPETSTNITLSVDMARLDRVVIYADISPAESNEVIVAVGHDSDGDGDLSFDEANFEFGMDCGARYFADLTTGRLAPVPEGPLVFRSPEWNGEWNLAKVIRRGGSAAAETVRIQSEGKKLAIRIR